MKQPNFFFKESKIRYQLRNLSSWIRYSITFFLLALLVMAWRAFFYEPLGGQLDRLVFSCSELKQLRHEENKYQSLSVVERAYAHKKELISSYSADASLSLIMKSIEEHKLSLESYAPGNSEHKDYGDSITHQFVLNGSYTHIVDFLETVEHFSSSLYCAAFSIKQHQDLYQIAIEFHQKK